MERFRNLEYRFPSIGSIEELENALWGVFNNYKDQFHLTTTAPHDHDKQCAVRYNAAHPLQERDKRWWRRTLEQCSAKDGDEICLYALAWPKKWIPMRFPGFYPMGVVPYDNGGDAATFDDLTTEIDHRADLNNDLITPLLPWKLYMFLEDADHPERLQDDYPRVPRFWFAALPLTWEKCAYWEVELVNYEEFTHHQLRAVDEDPILEMGVYAPLAEPLNEAEIPNGTRGNNRYFVYGWGGEIFEYSPTSWRGSLQGSRDVTHHRYFDRYHYMLNLQSTISFLWDGVNQMITAYTNSHPPMSITASLSCLNSRMPFYPVFASSFAGIRLRIKNFKIGSRDLQDSCLRSIGENIPQISVMRDEFVFVDEKKRLTFYAPHLCQFMKLYA